MRKKFFTVLMFFMLVAAVLMPIQTTVASNVYAQVISTNDSKPLVVCTTSVLASIVEDLADGDVEVKYLVSPSMCPGHYDVKPGDVETIRNASLILAHGMEWSGWLRELINSANQTGDLHVPIYNITGPWNTPPMLKQKYQTVASKLSEALGLNVSSKLSKCLDAIDQVDAELKSIVDKYGFNGTPVACMLWQKGFVEYLGFKIVAVYGPPEKVSARQYESIIANATEEGAILVIDNLQSGVELGKKIAYEIGAVEVAISNFPGVTPELNNVTQVMKWNAVKLAEALRSGKAMGEVAQLRREVDSWRIATVSASVICVAELLIIVALIVRLRKGR